MTEDHLDIWVKISQQIGELNGFIKTALDKLADHEKRLDDLEKEKRGAKDDGWKNQLLLLLAKASVIGAVAIGSLAGAGGILSKIFGGT